MVANPILGDFGDCFEVSVGEPKALFWKIFLLVHVLLPAFHAGSFKLLKFSCNLFGSFVFLSRLGCVALHIWFVRRCLGYAHIGVGMFCDDQGKHFKLRRRVLGLSLCLHVCLPVSLWALRTDSTSWQFKRSCDRCRGCRLFT